MPDATEVNKGHFETNWGGRREGAGRPPGAVTVNRYSKGPVLAALRREWRETHAADTMAALRELIDQKEDGWLRLAAIKEMNDRLWGKASQHVANVLSQNRREWRETYSDETMEELHKLVVQDEDKWLKLGAIKEMLDRIWGTSQQRITMDTDQTLATVYESIDDIRRDLIDSGLPVDHLEAPRLLRAIDVEPNKEPNK